MAIDERRCFFRQNLWSDPLPGQDLKQVWFAGVHSDIGGGYPEAESGLAKISLEWMLLEASKSGLIVKNERVAKVLGYASTDYAQPDAGAEMHTSLRDSWMLLEAMPHLYKDMSVVPPKTRVKIPLGRRRYIKPGVTIHESVVRRINLGIGYSPSNLPTDRKVEPWVRWSQNSHGAAG